MNAPQTWTGNDTYATKIIGRLTLTVTGETETGVGFPFSAYLTVDGDAPEYIGNYRTLKGAKIAASAIAKDFSSAW